MWPLIRYLASHYIPTRVYLQLFYRWRFGRWADLRSPTTLNEKFHWKKLYGHQPFHTTVCDKYAVREWVAGRIERRYLVPLIAVAESVEELDLGRLPDPCIIKTTRGSGQNIILRDNRSIEEKPLKNLLRKWMKQNLFYLSREPPYRDIKPRLVVEKLLTDSDGKIPLDFKFHCFHGEIEAIQVDIDRFTDHRRNFYDVNWELLPFTWSWWDRSGPLWPNGRKIERPAQLDEMMTVAGTLAEEFDYVRVDLYNCRGAVYFGELTLYHGGGWERFDPPHYDRIFGEKLDLHWHAR